MKKLISVLLLIIIVLSFGACTNKKDIVGTWKSDLSWTDDLGRLHSDFEYCFYDDSSCAHSYSENNKTYRSTSTWKLDGNKVIIEGGVYSNDSVYTLKDGNLYPPQSSKGNYFYYKVD